jgi:hypothetical protein
MESLEQLSFIVWVRESGSMWGYASFIFLHTLGLSTLAGVNAGVDLRVLGFAPALPLAPMRRLFPLMWAAFAVTAFSGIVLLMTETSKSTMPVFLIKLGFIALAVINLRLLYVRVFNNPQTDTGPIPPGGRLLAATSIALWVGATIAGRLMAYLTPTGGGF